jgi:uncharacterized membrane protein YozB (DUF420 family)
MEGLLPVSIDQLMIAGFMETRATLYIDIIVTYLVSLPILISLSIYAAIRELIKLHQTTQFLFFLVTLMTLALFAYHVHFSMGFEVLVQESSLPYMQAVSVLVIHAVIAVITLVLWIFALVYALSDYKRNALPGVYSESHAKAGRRVFYMIILTSLSTAALYWVLFVS